MLAHPCLDCGRPFKGGSRCETCQAKHDAARERYRPSRYARGYDAEYTRNRKIVVDRAWARGEMCIICGKPFKTKKEITGEHIIPRRLGGTSVLENIGPAHFWCNYSWNKKNRLGCREQ